MLIAQMGGISGARWQSDEQLHLTLRFIGEVDRHQAGDIDASLAAVRHPWFDLSIAGLGTFDKRGKVDAVWAGVSPPEAVTALHEKVNQALRRIGIAPDSRAFTPHITLARLNRSSGPTAHFLASGFPASPPFRVDSFTLCESHMGHGGSLYAPITTYRFDQAPSPNSKRSTSPA